VPPAARNLVLASAVAFVAGAGLVYALRAPGPRTESLARSDEGTVPERTRSSDAELSAAIRELSDAVGDLRLRIDALAGARRSVEPSTAADGIAVAPPNRDVGDTDLVAAMRELTNALRALPGSASSDFAEAPIVDRVKAFGTSAVLDAKLSGNRDQQRAAEDELDQKHRLWTARRVLETYGMPDEINTTGNGGLSWTYELEPVGGRRETYRFFLLDGLVYHVQDESSNR
jgi:hypothetical protein